MDVSVIIPTLNEAAEIEDCIFSARQAGATEIIVADGGSGDATVSIAQKNADQIISTDPSRAIQQNQGAHRAQGDILLFLHADNRMTPDCVNQIRAIHDHNASSDNWICGGFRQHIQAEGRKFRWIEQGNALRIRRLGWVYGDQGIFVSRDWFRAVGGFPEWSIMEDVEIMRRLIRSRQTEPSRQRPRLLPGPLLVNARRWQKKGVVRQTCRNLLMVTAWRCGASPKLLAKFYPPCPTPKQAQ